MPKAPRAMYQCSHCQQYMPSKERTKRRVVHTRPNGSKVQYDEDWCSACDKADTEGKVLRQTKGPTRAANGEGPSPAKPGPSSADRRPAEANGSTPRRGLPPKDTDSVTTRRSRSTTTGAR